MKINVTEEWREDIYLVEKQEIIKYVKSSKFKKIHHYSWNWGQLLIWADRSRDSVIETIIKADKVWITLGIARGNNLWHSLAVVNNETWLDLFDIKIELDNLIIKNKDG